MEEVGKVIDKQKTLLRKREEEVERLDTEVVELKEAMEIIIT